MALISCPECEKSISDQADNCPLCGYPIRKIISSAAAKHIVTIQATSKKWKVLQLIGGFLCIIGIISCSMVISKNSPGDPDTSGVFIFFIGFLLFFIGRLGAWWNNK